MQNELCLLGSFLLLASGSLISPTALAREAPANATRAFLTSNILYLASSGRIFFWTILGYYEYIKRENQNTEVFWRSPQMRLAAFGLELQSNSFSARCASARRPLHFVKRSKVLNIFFLSQLPEARILTCPYCGSYDFREIILYPAHLPPKRYVAGRIFFRQTR